MKQQQSIQQGKFKVEIAQDDMPAIKAIMDQFSGLKPFEGKNILGCVTVTPETANLMIALRALGANNIRWCSDNQYATDDDVANYMRSLGFTVFAKSNMTDEEYIDAMHQAANFSESDIAEGITIIDDGCDITDFLVRENPKLLSAVNLITEQTTCGINKFVNMFDEGSIPCPVVDINNSPAKRLFDNYYGVREAFIHALFNALPQQLAGKTVSVFGYGQVGEGTAKALRGLGCKLLIVEADTLKQVQAHFEGFEVVSKKEAIEKGDIVVLATGGRNVIGANDFSKAKDGAVFCNIGHGNQEFNFPALTSDNPTRQISEHLTLSELSTGQRIYSVSEGALVNMISGKGNPPRVMSLTFSLHLLTLMDYFKNPSHYLDVKLHNLDLSIAEKALRLNHPELEGSRTKLTLEERRYLGQIATPSLILTDSNNLLRRRPPKTNLGMMPTRMTSNDVLSDYTGVNLSVKLECEADILGSGNKVRKLSYLFPHIIDQGSTDLIMDGTVNSNSCMAVAFYAHRLGIKTHFILSGEETYQGNHKLIIENASSIDHIGEWDPQRITEAQDALKEEIKSKGKKPYLVPTGVSNHITAFAGLELLEEAIKQTADNQVSYEHVVLPVGTGSTLAGFQMAQSMYKIPFEIHGAAVANDREFFTSVTQEIYGQLTKEGYGDFSAPKEELSSIWEKSVGLGYGVASQEDHDLMKDIERRSGILFDSVYTFKALKAVREMREDGKIKAKSRVMMVHTGGNNERFIKPNII